MADQWGNLSAGACNTPAAATELVGRTIKAVSVSFDMDPDGKHETIAESDPRAIYIECTDGLVVGIGAHGESFPHMHKIHARPDPADDEHEHLRTFGAEPASAPPTDCTCIGHEGEDPMCKIHGKERPDGPS